MDGNIIQKFERLEREMNEVQMDSLDVNVLNGGALDIESKDISNSTSSEDDHGFSSQYGQDNSQTHYLSTLNENIEDHDDSKRPISEGSTSESSGRGSGTSMNQFSNHAPKLLKNRQMFGSTMSSNANSNSNESGSGNRIYVRNLSIDSMFPPQMPPVESFPGMRSKGSASSSGASSKMGFMPQKKAKRGVTTYDNEGPKTEL